MERSDDGDSAVAAAADHGFGHDRRQSLPYWSSDVPQPPLLTIDGSRASGEGPHIWADNVVVSSVALVHFKSSDAIIIEGNDAILAWVSEDDAANGLRIRGLRAGVYGSGFDDNRDTGLVIESSSHDNTIGRLRSGCPPVEITAATRYQTLITARGEAHAAPNRKLLVSLYALASSQLDCGVFLGQIGSASATTDAAGNAHFDINAPAAHAEALNAAVTELDADGNATATSELSAPFNPATNVEPTADLSVEIAAPPSVVYGQEITIVTRVTNHGPGASVPYTVSFPLGVGLVYLDNFCSVCQEPPLAPGQTAVIEQRVRVLGRGTALPYRAEVRGYGLNDPNPANNDATIVVAISPAPTRTRAARH